MNFRAALLALATMVGGCAASVGTNDGSTPTDALATLDGSRPTDGTTACSVLNVMPVQFTVEGGFAGGIQFRFTVGANGVVTVQVPNCMGGGECSFTMNRCRTDGPRSYEEHASYVATFAPILQLGANPEYGSAVPDGTFFTIRSVNSTGTIRVNGISCNGRPGCTEPPAELLRWMELVAGLWLNEAQTAGCTCRM